MENKKSKNYIIVTIISIFVLIGFVYFDKNPKDVNIENIEKNTDLVSDISQIPENDQTEPNYIDSSVVSNDDKFNLYLTDARKAFSEKKYEIAINYYKESLSYRNSDLAYSGLFTVYSAQGEWLKAKESIDQAIKINPSYVDYWRWKLSLLDEKTDTTFLELKKIYEQGMLEIDPRRKIDLVTHFAFIASSNNEKNEAISLWGYAIDLYPKNKDIYQAEIDSLKK